MKIEKVCANCEHWQQFPPYRMLPMLEGVCNKIEGKRRFCGGVRMARTKYTNHCEKFLLRNKTPL